MLEHCGVCEQYEYTFKHCTPAELPELSAASSATAAFLCLILQRVGQLHVLSLIHQLLLWCFNS